MGEHSQEVLKEGMERELIFGRHDDVKGTPGALPVHGVLCLGFYGVASLFRPGMRDVYLGARDVRTKPTGRGVVSPIHKVVDVMSVKIIGDNIVEILSSWCSFRRTSDLWDIWWGVISNSDI